MFRTLFLCCLLCFTIPGFTQLHNANLSQLETLNLSGKWKEALELWESFSEAEQVSPEAILWKYRLLLHEDRGKEAKAALDKLLQLTSEREEQAPPFYILIRQLQWETLSRNKESATELYKRIHAQEEDLPHADKFMWHYIAGLYQQKIDGDRDAAWEHYQQALPYMDSARFPDPAAKGGLIRELGNHARGRLGLEHALDYYQQELAIYERHYADDHLYMGIPHFNIGTIYYEWAEYQLALDHYLINYKIWKAQDSLKGKYKRYFRLLTEATGDMYWELGNREKALAFYDESVEGEGVINNDQGKSLVLNGDSLLAKGAYDAALPYYQKALAFREEAFGKSHPLTGACNNFIASAYEKKGEWQHALESYQLSLQIMHKDFVSNDWRENPILNQVPGFERYNFEALTGKGRILLQLYATETDPDLLFTAWKTFDMSVQLIDLVRQSPISTTSKLYWMRQVFPAYEYAIETALMLYDLEKDKLYLEAAFRYMEKSKAFLLLAAAQDQESQRIKGVPPEVLDKEIALQAGIREYRVKVNREEERCGQSRNKQLELWRQKLLNLREQYDQHLAFVKEHYPEYYQLKFEVEVRSLEEVKQELTDDESLLTLFEGEQKLYAFIIQAEQVILHQFSISETYRSTLDRLYLHLSDLNLILDHPEDNFRTYTAAAHQLFQMLFPEVIYQQLVSTEELIIVPDGKLSKIPFEVLLTQQLEENQARNYHTLPYLLKEKRIRYAPSASLLFSLTEKKQQPFNKRWVGIAPDYASFSEEKKGVLAPLAYNQTEVSRLADLVSGQALTAEKASEYSFRKLAPQAKVLHIAAHARVNDERPSLSHFVLQASPQHDGWLHTYELYDLPLSAELAILSACNTGAGAVMRGEGMMSLGRAFHFAGCPSVMMSLWAIDDRASTELMLAFYEELRLGVDRSEALRTAKLQYLEQALPTASHPFFWAGFVLNGEGGEIMMAGINWEEILTWVFAVLLGLLILIVVVKGLNSYKFLWEDV